MAFSVIAAVASLRITYLLQSDGSVYYISSLVATFENVTSTINSVSILVIIGLITGLILRFRNHPLDVFVAIMTIAMAFILGIWMTTLSYSSIQYDTTSWWMVGMIALNLLISYLLISIPLALVGLFVTQVLRS